MIVVHVWGRILDLVSAILQLYILWPCALAQLTNDKYEERERERTEDRPWWPTYTRSVGPTEASTIPLCRTFALQSSDHVADRLIVTILRLGTCYVSDH